MSRVVATVGGVAHHSRFTPGFVRFTHSTCLYYSQLFSTTQIGLATTVIIRTGAGPSWPCKGGCHFGTYLYSQYVWVPSTCFSLPVVEFFVFFLVCIAVCALFALFFIHCICFPFIRDTLILPNFWKRIEQSVERKQEETDTASVCTCGV